MPKALGRAKQSFGICRFLHKYCGKLKSCKNETRIWNFHCFDLRFGHKMKNYCIVCVEFGGQELTQWSKNIYYH